LVMQHGPVISDPRPSHELLVILEEVIQHQEAGNSFGLLTKLTKRRWFEFAEKVRLGSRALQLDDRTHVRAAHALVRMRQLRSELIERWQRQMERQGGLPCSELGQRPEQVCKQFVPQILSCLEWHTKTWQPLEKQFQQLGFHWSVF